MKLNDILPLLAKDNKAFVMDEHGEVKLVIVGVEEYERLVIGKLQKQIEDIETINQEIIKAQLEDGTELTPLVDRVDISKMKPQRIDMRSEVIDSAFDLDTAMRGPVLDDAEAVEPEFDDI